MAKENVKKFYKEVFEDIVLLISREAGYEYTMEHNEKNIFFERFASLRKRGSTPKITGTVCAPICRMAVVSFPTMRQNAKQKVMP